MGEEGREMRVEKGEDASCYAEANFRSSSASRTSSSAIFSITGILASRESNLEVTSIRKPSIAYEIQEKIGRGECERGTKKHGNMLLSWFESPRGNRGKKRVTHKNRRVIEV